MAVTTKQCPVCGNRDLVRLSTHNIKICPDCRIDIPWHREEGEPPFYPSQPVKTSN
jgi:uncharacterized protein (DUF983 family)